MKKMYMNMSLNNNVYNNLTNLTTQKKDLEIIKREKNNKINSLHNPLKVFNPDKDKVIIKNKNSIFMGSIIGRIYKAKSGCSSCGKK